MSTNKRVLLAILGIAVILSLVLYARHSVTHAGPGTVAITEQPPPSQTYNPQTQAPTQTAAPGQTDSARPATLDPISAAAVVSVARQFVTAYQQRSYTDATPTTWVDRCKTFVTNDFLQTIQNQANSDGTNWQRFVQSKGYVKVTAKPNQPVVDGGQTYVGVPFNETLGSAAGAPVRYPGFLTVYVTYVGTAAHGVWLVSGLSTSTPPDSGN